MYLTFEVNTSKVKSSRHIEMNYENKKARAVGLAESIMNQCVILYNNLRSVVKVDKMCRSLRRTNNAVPVRLLQHGY